MPSSGAWWCSWLRHSLRSRVQFPMESLGFLTDMILPATLWSWGRLSLYKKWEPGIHPGDKGGGCVGLTTSPPSCVDWSPKGLFRPVMGRIYLYMYRRKPKLRAPRKNIRADNIMEGDRISNPSTKTLKLWVLKQCAKLGRACETNGED